ncbi:Glutamine--tRNA ligase [uncultured Clostridium sp.]|nr:Glutamine--tRNA ligase [uncultured Clostridium sp.]
MCEENGTPKESLNFIEEIIAQDLETGKHEHILTRFPPEPNGYLHIGHAKAVCINFGMKDKFGGRTFLRFDDTNPSKEDTEYVDSIMEDIHWLGFEWDELRYASDYFERMYEAAEKLIREGKAYVCDLTPEQMREYRGTLTAPGRPSPYRDRSVEENLELFRGMRAGQYPDGSRVLRAKIDMASPNINMRDPVLYRIVRAHHHRTGDKWCIYPMYDFAHPLEDAIEGVTHSLCSLEFEDHRPLYDWVVREVGFPHPPRQIEFARLNLTRTLMSKRYLRALVESGTVEGWDDPRMPTLSGLRRRGYPPQAIREFCARVGVAKANSLVDAAMLESCVRDSLNDTAPRAMAVLRPLKVVLTNYPEGESEMVTVENHPAHPEMGTREVPFSRELYIEQEDFMMDPPKKFFRLAPGREVRLKDAYIIKCEEAVTDADGNVIELRCTYDPESRSGLPGSARKVKGTLHWVDAKTCREATVRLYDYLLGEQTQDEDGNELTAEQRMNPDSIKVLSGCKVEPRLAQASAGETFQFMRQGYFTADSKLYTPDNPVFNATVSLKDSYKKAVIK